MAAEKEIVFSKLPEDAKALLALPQAALSTPFDTAALAVTALLVYPDDREEALAMLDVLKGPGGGLKPNEKQFLRDRLEGKGYLPRSYFKGSKPDNDYTPAEPATICVSENAHSYDNDGYAKVFVACKGADTPRPVTLRQTKDKKWYLWEFSSLLTGIREPESSNPWA